MDDADLITKYPRRLVRRLLGTYHGFSEHDGSLMAAAMAYYFALSLFPLLLVLLAGLGMALESTVAGQDAQERLLAAIEQQVSPELSAQIGRALRTVSSNASSRGPIGFVVLLVTAIAIFAQVDHAFNRIWRLPDDMEESWLNWLGRLAFQRFKALLMLLAAGAFVLAATLASLVWAAVEARLEPTLELAAEVQWVPGLLTNVFLNFCAFTLVYRFVPRVGIRWGEALRGATLAAILWEVGRQLLGIYLIHLGYPTAYGVIGSFIAIMLWAYYAMIVVFLGAEYTRVVREESTAATASPR
jgi:membrane protein